MSRIFNLMICSTIFIFLLAGCGGEEPESSQGQVSADQDQKPIQIYTTIYPLYDFAKKIAGNQAHVENIVPPGVESHDFEPTVQDMMNLNKAQIFIYNGAGFEGWVEKALSALNQSKLIVVNTSEQVKVLGDESDHSAEHGHEGIDPHIWLDPNRAKVQAEAIKNALVQIDPAHQTYYEENFEELTIKFNELDQDYKDLRTHANRTDMLVSHAAFGYLADAYGFEQIAISGLSPSDEPSTKELQQIVELAKEREIHYILFETIVSGKVAEVVKSEVGAEALTLNTIESLSEEEMDEGQDYFTVMQKNLETLKIALQYK
ncbi:metal ABC transporter substrate-binding protein [Ammoniphilus resinae]|uniref:Zinc transport system substrate-binding protein n=1 Tax=Ammoniphilus resinae TaxID=861532 RepID=A0ABS4GS75_9BACL|nr:metal ABC transporter substrate-binding protein [Ammoniphilus resinae]MBP1933133.1 zinc transport system substrate-binding protein [Ammoniphilus resinae]